MFNPFERFELRFIDAFKKRNKRYLVSQTYKRGYDHFENNDKDHILLSHYDDKNKAIVHKRALGGDRFAAIIDLENPAHVEKLKSMLMPDSKYVVFSILVSDTEALNRRIRLKFESNIRRYIQNKTNWRIGGEQELKTQYEITFGELYIIMKYGNKQPIRIKFEEIENS
ncbi:hypothetical protein FRZ67_19310 [Panacibacter ginsenosidivorans]|uniref:Uncharacterized protein n=1 Tax=Panacibacter ginsenosidivorans TaxID=1813871 RepID=A0A5B8VCZ5_9BACT|nr:hypothetical protein [Panacibacter ginsenosidivorans]QEC69350.1 hypothetical protein FRZ67_19310 [Panacibacter ginsenosidivorans]